MDKRVIIDELIVFIGKSTEELGYEFVDIITSSGRNFSIEIIIDKKGGITLDECGDFNKSIVAWIEKINLFQGEYYTLDVCSPGLDRELKSDRALSWAEGRQVELRIFEPVEEKKVFIGKLIRTNFKEEIKVEDSEGKVFCVVRSNVAKIKLRTSYSFRKEK